MSVRRSSRATEHHTTRALLLRVVPFGEADTIVTLFTEKLGRVPAMARHARSSKVRTSGRLVLEPMHTLLLQLELRPPADLGTIRESALDVVRLRLTRRLDALDVAGHALRWVRDVTPPDVPEPALWVDIVSFLDRLDADPPPASPKALLAATGLRVLEDLGYGLDLAACVACARECPPTSSALLDPGRRGIVCRACGGGAFLVPADRRNRAAAAITGDDDALLESDAAEVLRWVEVALERHHGGSAPRRGRKGALCSFTPMDHVLANKPIRVRAPRGAREFEVHWADGTVGKIPHLLLRGYCPCAGCQGHSGKIRFVEGGDLELESIAPVGNYALQLTWGDHHDSGIYSFRYLRSLTDLAEKLAGEPDAERPKLARL